MPAGWVNERVNLSDWAEGVGEIFHGSCWSEISVMLTYLEIPGLYAQLDTGVFCVMDHVDARLISFDGTSISFELTNPTQFPARIKAYVEVSAETTVPLPQNFLQEHHLVNVPAETKIVVHLTKDFVQIIG